MRRDAVGRYGNSRRRPSPAQARQCRRLRAHQSKEIARTRANAGDIQSRCREKEAPMFKKSFFNPFSTLLLALAGDRAPYSSKRGSNRNRACHLVVYDYNERLFVTPTRCLWFCCPVIPVAPSFQRHLKTSAAEWRDVAFRRLRGQKLGQSQKSDTFQELLLKLKSLLAFGSIKTPRYRRPKN